MQAAGAEGCGHQGLVHRRRSGGRSVRRWRARPRLHQRRAEHRRRPRPSGTKRPFVAVPVALGAEVVGVGNGYGSGGKKVPFPTIEVTPDEMAAVVASGQFTPADDQASMTARNPDLSGNFFAQTTIMQTGVPSGVSSSTWFLTKYLSTAAPGSWKVPPVGAAGVDAGKPRGVFNDFGTAQPDFTLLTTYTGRPTLRQALVGIVNDTFLLGGVYVVSDLTTAIAEGLVPMAIQNQAGGPFVAPDQAGMDAAVADMAPDSNGMLQPSPHPSDPAAYPLTYVVYAMVPTQPLVDATCTPRTSSQIRAHELARLPDRDRASNSWSTACSPSPRISPTRPRRPSPRSGPRPTPASRLPRRRRPPPRPRRCRRAPERPGAPRPRPPTRAPRPARAATAPRRRWRSRRPRAARAA